jgi:hypothetical protein
MIFLIFFHFSSGEKITELKKKTLNFVIKQNSANNENAYKPIRKRGIYKFVKVIYLLTYLEENIILAQSSRKKKKGLPCLKERRKKNSFSTPRFY